MSISTLKNNYYVWEFFAKEHILKKISNTNIDLILKLRRVSKLFYDIILNNKDIKFTLSCIKFKNKSPLICLQIACENKNLDICKWLMERFQIVQDDVRNNHNETLRIACKYGNLKVVKWLINTFHLTKEDLNCYVNNTALSCSCDGGNLKILSLIPSNCKMVNKYIWVNRKRCNRME